MAAGNVYQRRIVGVQIATRVALANKSKEDEVSLDDILSSASKISAFIRDGGEHDKPGGGS